MRQKAPRHTVLAYDLGGTKVSAGAVSSDGEVLEEIRVPIQLDSGKKSLLKQLTELGNDIRSRHKSIRRAGIASAGPLDPDQGILLDPTNFGRHGKRFGKVAIAQLLSGKLKIPVHLDNDAAAAILAEHWIGAAKGIDNAMILTLGTGLGTGIIANGTLVRAGRNLHPEAGHLIIQHEDMTALCGCGNHGCAEAYLSGGGFTRRARLLLKNPVIETTVIADRARQGSKKEKALFQEYAWLMAIAIQNYVRIYSPELIVLTGSFAHASDLFLPQVRKNLLPLLAHQRVGIDLLPKIKLSRLHNQAGLIGGAVIAMR